MEHRWGRRVAVNIEVQILADPASAGWGRLRDISVSGGFLETGLRIGALSTLCLTVPALRFEDVRTIRAIAVRRDVGGIGIEWCEGGDADVIATLIQDATHWPSRPRAVAESYVAFI